MTISRFDDILFDGAVFDGFSSAVSHLFATITGGRNARTLASSVVDTHVLICPVNMGEVVLAGGLSMMTQHLDTHHAYRQTVTLEVEA